MADDPIAELDDDEETEAPKEWMTTLSDVSMLLMTFFVLLFSMSSLDTQKFTESINAVRNALGGTSKATMSGPVATKAMSTLIEQARLKQRILGEQHRVFDQFRSYVSEKGLEGVVGATLEAGKITITLPAGVLFAKDSVNLSAAGKVQLKKLFDFLIKTPGERINIRGFTDDQPPGPGSRFRDNWEISSLRAVSVLRFMLSLGLPPNRLTATGLADLEPLYPNTTPEHRAKNQRVEFALERWIGE